MPNYTFPENNTALFSAKAATGVSTPLDVSAMREITVAVSAPANATLTFKFQGSIGKSASSSAAPDFSAAQSVTNHWDYVSAYDLQDPTSVIAGDTGVTLDNLTAAQNTRLYTINVGLFRHFSMQVSSFTDGYVSAWLVASQL